jgi:hypothetical protein
MALILMKNKEYGLEEKREKNIYFNRGRER